MLQPVFIAHLLLRTISLRARHCYLLKIHISRDPLNEAATTAHGLILAFRCFENGNTNLLTLCLYFMLQSALRSTPVWFLGTIPPTVSQCPAGRVTQPLLPARTFSAQPDWPGYLEIDSRRFSCSTEGQATIWMSSGWNSSFNMTWNFWKTC